VIEIGLFIRLNLTERMEILYQLRTMVPGVVTSANTLQSTIDHPEKYEKMLHRISCWGYLHTVT
jgi:autonomous glycyl radical cofactor GrcA